MIKRLKIVNLFDRFDYDIDLGKDLTILTGPNGYGKSTILKILMSINKGNFIYFSRLNFERIEVEFINDDRKLILEKEVKGDSENIKINGISIKEYINLLDSKEYVYFNKINNMIKLIESNDINYKLKAGINSYESKIDYINNLKSSVEEELFTDYIEVLSESKKCLRNIKAKNKIKIKDTIDILEKNKEDIYFIKEQRLYKNIDNEKIIEIIDDIPRKIKKIINETSQKYSKKANSIDSTYPSRLFKTLNGITEEEYNLKLEKLMVKFEKLNDYDISDITLIDNVKFKEEHSKALKVYFDDFDEKYKVYEDDINKFDSFKKIINNKLSFKNIKISKEDGLSVFNDSG